MKKLLIAALLLSVFNLPVGMAKDTPTEVQLPKVLIIGDSISLGYTPSVIEMLKGEAEVVHHKGNKSIGPNGGPTMRGVKYIDDWLGETQWDVIHFNWGLWDMYGWHYEKVDRSPPEYEKRLDILVRRLKQTGAKLIWATTTPACPGPENLCKIKISKETEREYLDAALRVMKKHGVKVNDLYGFMDPQRQKYALGDNDVHFTREGSGKLAEQVAKHIRDVLTDANTQECAIPIAGAKWIGAPGEQGPLPIFRKSFLLNDDAIASARVAICGLGHFELSVNGNKVGDHFLDPPWSDYAETCYYVCFDVTELLNPGENVLGVMLGNGMYNVTGGRYTKFVGSYGPPRLTLCMMVSQGGTEKVITSEKSWKTDAGPITFSCIYGGEDYDARKEQPGWDKPGFDDSRWQQVKVVDGPGGTLRPATSPPIKIVRHLEPVSVTKLKDGRYEVDLGENLSARPVIKVKGNAGRRVTIEVAERKGEPWKGHSYSYTLKGDAQPEYFAPRFTYFGFQYLYLSGAVWGDDVTDASGVPELVGIGADFLSSCGPRIGSFACSNPLFNQIDDMIDRSVASNLQHVLTDCPHREKLGWLEVSHLMGPSILFNYDMGGLYRKICRDTTDAQLENGLVPDIAPEFVRFNGGFFESPEWGSASVQLPWLIHHWYGDGRILSEQYQTMARYADYLAGTRNQEGLVKGGLGDWYDWTEEKGHVGHSQLTPSELPAMCMLYDNARILKKAAAMQGMTDQVRKWEGLAQEVRRDFLAAWYDKTNKTVATGSQCALAMGLYFDLVPTEDRDAVLANLVANIERSQYRQSTGEVSFRYLVLALAQAGRSDVVYRMINRTDAPGYGCMLKQYGLKTLSERWDRPGSSLNHCMFGHIQEWFQKYLLGIRQAPGSTGYQKVLIDPFIPDDLQWAKGSFDSPNGRIEVAWVRKGEIVELTVNAEKAEVILPKGRKNINVVPKKIKMNFKKSAANLPPHSLTINNVPAR
ncbi:MAG: family 78 glycoside hydrolase catalytic domain [Phycisphaerae bacterium]|nr:family 78 glycoside hydrolase catalytic domain [Phycisphaerae bacterium]